MDVKYKDMKWIDEALGSPVLSCCDHCNEPPDSLRSVNSLLS
jgi:hypothetical protein